MAAKLISTQYNFQKIPILGLVAESSANGSPPATPVNGQFWYDTTNNRMMIRENGAWVPASNENALTTASTAGGDLSGTFSNLQIGALAVGTAELANDAVTYAKLQNVSTTDRLLGRDTAAAGDAEEISVGGGIEFTGSQGIQTSAFTGDVTKTAGGTALTIAANAVTLAKLATAVTLAGIASTNASAGDITASNQKITNLATPTNGTDAANKAYVDGIASGLDPKASVRAASTANVAVTYNATGGTSGRGQITAAPNTLDGVTLAANDRILLKNQTTGQQNGIWVVTTLGTGANGVWDRATDFDQDAEVTSGAYTFVEEGTQNDNTGWVLTTNNPITIGGGAGTALTWAQFTGAGSITAGDGLTQSGNTINAVGTTNRISVTADAIDIAATYVGQTSITTLGTITTGTWNGTDIAVADGGTGSSTAAGARANLGAVGKYAADLGALTAGVALTITHNLNTTDVIASFRAAGAGGHEIVMDWEVTDANSIKVTSDLAYSASAIRATVIG
jgi:hypothetical protein